MKNSQRTKRGEQKDLVSKTAWQACGKADRVWDTLCVFLHLTLEKRTGVEPVLSHFDIIMLRGICYHSSFIHERAEAWKIHHFRPRQLETTLEFEPRPSGSLKLLLWTPLCRPSVFSSWLAVKMQVLGKPQGDFSIHLGAWRRNWEFLNYILSLKSPWDGTEDR